MASKSPKKRAAGRPKKKPVSPHQLIAQAQAGIKATTERFGQINYEETEDKLSLMLSEDRLKECTFSEIRELRRMAERLWDKFQCEKEYAADQEWMNGYGIQRKEAEELTEEEQAWIDEHAFLKPQRKNAKKTKNVFTLTDRQKERKGLALEPTQMEFDIAEAEAELEQKLMQAAINHKQVEVSELKGRRVEGRKRSEPWNQKNKSFWI